MVSKAEIVSVIEEVAAEQGKKLAPLSNELGLIDSGLDSLCLAIIVARLEDLIGFDAFTANDGGFPTTVGEFISFYEATSDAEPKVATG